MYFLQLIREFYKPVYTYFLIIENTRLIEVVKDAELINVIGIFAIAI